MLFFFSKHLVALIKRNITSAFTNVCLHKKNLYKALLVPALVYICVLRYSKKALQVFHKTYAIVNILLIQL